MRRTALTIVATIVGLVLLLQFKTHALGGSTSGGLASIGAVPASSTSPRTKTTAQPPISTATKSPTKSPTASKTSTPTATPTKTPSTPKTVTATGQTIQTRYGPVQVRITETSGRLTNAVAIQLPGGDPHSSQIAAYAAPILRTEALKAGSARIDIVSGATYTSDGYAQSLQSALDNA